jgi:hypothetical protein
MPETIVKGAIEHYTLEINDGGIRNIDNLEQIAIRAETAAKRYFAIPQTLDSPMEKTEVIYFSLKEFVVGPSGHGISFKGLASPNGPNIEKTVENAFVDATRPITNITMLDLASGKTFDVAPVRIDKNNSCRLHAEKLTCGH